MLKKINKKKVQLPEGVNMQFDPKKVKGSALFPEPYANIFICAKKKSGKSTVVYNIIKDCIDQDTCVYVFCSTYKKDPSWLATRKWLDEHEIYSEFYQSIKADDGTDVLSEIISELRENDEEEEEEKKDKPKTSVIKVDGSDEEEPKKRKKRKLACQAMFIFDDISAELKHSSSVITLLKQNRHYKSKTIISTQYLHDLRPESLLQQDYFLIFPGIPEDKLALIYKTTDLTIDFDKFLSVYYLATEEKFHFLYIDVRQATFRKDFNMQITV